MKILITGGMGFIGAHIANTLKKEHEITILDNFDAEYPGYEKIYRGKALGVVNATRLEMSHRRKNVKYRFYKNKNILIYDYYLRKIVNQICFNI